MRHLIPSRIRELYFQPDAAGEVLRLAAGKMIVSSQRIMRLALLALLALASA